MRDNLTLLNYLIRLVFLIVVSGISIALFYPNPKEETSGFACGVTSSNYDNLSYQDQLPFEKGKTLFRTNCKACHNENMQADMIGPALGEPVEKFWEAKPTMFLTYLKDTENYEDPTDPRASKIKEWDPIIICTGGKNLNQEDANALILYITRKTNGILIYGCR